MRNAKQLAAKTICALALAGCAAQPPAELKNAQASIDARDYPAAAASADAAIAKRPASADLARAYYLKGRAIEQLSSDTPADARQKLQQARTAYIAALKADGEHGPLEGYIRAGIANVSYWQEDYTTAAQQGLAAGPLLSDPTSAAWTYYRAGLSQQRLGDFALADKSFAQAIAVGPSTDPAVRAQAHKGIRSFKIRVLIDGKENAESRGQTLSKSLGQGVTVRRNVDGADAEFLIGSYPTYAAAMSQRSKLLSQFPNASVVP